MEKYLNRLCKNILAGRFDDLKYRDKREYYGVSIQTGPLFCSYGQIGFTVDVYHHEQFHISWDWEMKELTINDRPWKEIINEVWLESETDMSVHRYSDGYYELELYTDAGGDMTISLDHLMIDQLEEYINNFDINEEISLWWHNGEPGNGVPFDNMKEHYEDLEAWVTQVKIIAIQMPY